MSPHTTTNIMSKESCYLINAKNLNNNVQIFF